jgi:hypothetical protein
VTCYTQSCKPCKVLHIMHYLPQGDASSPRGGWGICAPALPEVLTAFIEFCQALPACSNIFPLNTKVPTFGFFPHFLVAAMLDVHFSRSNGMAISSVVKNAFHKILLFAFNVTFSIHIFCNHIGRVFITASIWKLNFISSCI